MLTRVVAGVALSQIRRRGLTVSDMVAVEPSLARWFRLATGGAAAAAS